MPIPLSVLLARLSQTLESARILAVFGPDNDEVREGIRKHLDTAQSQLATIQEVAP